MKKTIYTILLSLWLIPLISQDVKLQDTGTWGTLSMVTFSSEFDEEWGIDIQKPTVSPIVMRLNETEIEVSGYIIPLTGKITQNHFMFSAFPLSTCFFCGKAGPETAMQVFMKDGKKVPYQDEKIKIKGILKINPTDAMSLLYTLEDATVINE